MAARLPTTIESGPVRGETPSTDIARATDYGIGDAAQAFGAYARVHQERVDHEAGIEATRLIQEQQRTYEPEFAKRAAAYDGREAGFAAAETAAFEEAVKPLRDRADLPEAVRIALRDRIDQAKTVMGSRAIDVESQKRGNVVAEQEAVKKEAELGGQLVAFNADFSTRYQARADQFDGSQAGFAKGVLTDFDETAKAALDKAPEDQRAVLERRLTAMRVQIHAQALQTEDAGHGAFVVSNARKTLDGLTNTVLTNPAAYEATSAQIDAAAAGVPASKRREFMEGAASDLAYAYVQGLIQKGETGHARQELEGGRLDGKLAPEKKEHLLARLEAAETAGPKTVEEWRQAYEADANLDAEVEARASGRSTGFSLQSIVGIFSPREIAAAEAKLAQADKVFAATGNLRAQSNTALRDRAIAPPPAEGSPDYANAHRAWELSRKAAAAELAEREKDPAAWAMRSEVAGDTGAQLQARWKAFAEADDATEQGKAGRGYASLVLGLQMRAGVPAASLRVLTKDQAGELASSFARATPEQRPAALRALAQTVAALPSNVAMGDGRTVSARQLAARELRAAGLGSGDISAMVDLADNPGKLDLYADAVSNPAALKALPGKGEEANLRAAVDSRLDRFFETANVLPGSADLNNGRMSRVMNTARHLVLTRGMSVAEAARAASADLVEGYQFVDGYRVPQGVDRGAVKRGATMAMLNLSTEKLLPAPGNPALTREQAQAKTKDIIDAHGRWVTNEDDGGLTLMLPDTRGWTPAADAWGRPIRLSWAELQDVSRWTIHSGQKADYFVQPPGAATQPPRTAAPAKAKAAFAAAIEHQESRGVASAESAKGASGIRQIMPATARTLAERAGLRMFEGRSDDQVKALLKTDVALNRKLSDSYIEFLAKRYDGNIGLVAAAYNAGEGRVDGWLKKIGDPRKGRLTLDEWVAALPAEFGETRDYVRSVLPKALANLQRG